MGKYRKMKIGGKVTARDIQRFQAGVDNMPDLKIHQGKGKWKKARYGIKKANRGLNMGLGDEGKPFQVRDVAKSGFAKGMGNVMKGLDTVVGLAGMAQSVKGLGQVGEGLSPEAMSKGISPEQGFSNQNPDAVGIPINSEVLGAIAAKKGLYVRKRNKYKK